MKGMTDEQVREYVKSQNDYIKRLEALIESEIEIPLRDKFAGLALAGMDTDLQEIASNKGVIAHQAKLAYVYADAMMKARKQ